MGAAHRDGRSVDLVLAPAVQEQAGRAGARRWDLALAHDLHRPLAAALRTVAATTGAGIEEAVARTLSIVRQVVPVRLCHRVDVLRVTAVESPGPGRIRRSAPTGS